MSVRLTKKEDIPRCLEIIDLARARMRAEGNLNQWVKGYPGEDQILEDIQNQCAYVYEEEGKVLATFAFILGEDPTYSYIEGEWTNDEYYGTIHRIASDGSKKGILHRVLDYCQSRVSNIRIDTHEDNKSMRAVLDKEGFQYCGIIYIKDGSPRRAYLKSYRKDNK